MKERANIKNHPSLFECMRMFDANQMMDKIVEMVLRVGSEITDAFFQVLVLSDPHNINPSIILDAIERETAQFKSKMLQ